MDFLSPSLLAKRTQCLCARKLQALHCKTTYAKSYYCVHIISAHDILYGNVWQMYLFFWTGNCCLYREIDSCIFIKSHDNNGLMLHIMWSTCVWVLFMIWDAIQESCELVVCGGKEVTNNKRVLYGYLWFLLYKGMQMWLFQLFCHSGMPYRFPHVLIMSLLHFIGHFLIYSQR